MKLADIGLVTELVCRRGELLGWKAAVKRGDFGLKVGGDVVMGDGLVAVRSGISEMIDSDLARNTRQLVELGVEMDDAEPSAGVPACRVSGTHPVAAAR